MDFNGLNIFSVAHRYIGKREQGIKDGNGAVYQLKVDRRNACITGLSMGKQYMNCSALSWHAIYPDLAFMLFDYYLAHEKS